MLPFLLREYGDRVEVRQTSPAEMAMVLNRSQILAELPESVRDVIAAELTAFDVNAGEVLLEQGAGGDAIWVLDEGLLEVRRRIGGASRRVGLLTRGSVFGEGPLLAGDDRSADVVALRDSRVMALDQDAIRNVLSDQPDVVFALTRLLLRRRGQVASVLDPPMRVLTAVPIDSDESSDRLLDHLEDAAEAVGMRVARVRADDAFAMDAAELFSGGQDPPELLLADGAGDEEWRRVAVRNADGVLLATAPSADPAPQPVEAELTGQRVSSLAPILVLVGEPPSGLLVWTAGRGESQVRFIDNPEHAKELLIELSRGHPDLAWLQRTELFGGLDAAVLTSVAARFSWSTLPAGTPLFEAGDDADALYVLVEGRLVVHLSSLPTGSTALLKTGAMVGEMGVLRDEPRSATVTAVRDSVVAKLSRSDYDAIQQLEPEVGRRLTNLVLTRLAPTRSDRKSPEGLVVAAIPIGPATWLQHEARLLDESLRGLGSSATIDRALVEQAIGAGGADLEPGAPAEHALIQLLARREEQAEYMLLVGDAAATQWTRRCVRQADVVLLFVDASEPPPSSPIMRELQSMNRIDASTILVLVHPPGSTRAERTGQWLERLGVELWAHVVRDSRADRDRLARRVTRRALGLALSGGGSRGAAHLGVVRAIEERGLAIDSVSGTSAGGAVAGLVARQLTLEESTSHVEDLLGGVGGHFKNLGPPIVSLMSGSHVRDLLRPWFEDLRIEDLFIPLYVAASDVTTGRAVAIDRGPVWEAVRASTSVPGLWPPVVRDGRLHVDGGVLNNLPADFLDRDCRHGTIVGSDVAALDDKPKPYFADPDVYVSGWRVLWERRVLRQRRRRSRIGSTVMRSMLVSSQTHLERTIREHVDVLIRPDLHRVGMFEVRTPDRVAWAADRGYEAAVVALDEAGL